MKKLLPLIDYSKLLDRIGKSDLEVASVELGQGINYFPVPEGFIEIGKQESDPIVIEESTGEVAILDHEVSGRIMCYVANNLVAFIYALGVIEEHYEKCEKNEDLYEDENFMRSSARKAATRAGGGKYEDFWIGLFGI